MLPSALKESQLVAKLYKKATGPVLFQVTERHSASGLAKWIVNSAASNLLLAVMAEQNAIYNEYNQS
jgi:hypothetical protein